MALVRLQDVDWTLTDKRQDIRGRELRDAVGRSLGEIEQMIVDTEQERVVTVRLQDATEYPADDLQIMEDAVYYIPPDVPAAPVEPATAETGAVSLEADEAAAPAAIAPVALASPTGDRPEGSETEPAAGPPVVRVPESDPEVPAPPGAAPPIPPSRDDRGVADPSMTPPEITIPDTDTAIPAPPDTDAEPRPAPAAEPQAPGAYLDADFRNHFASEYGGSRVTYAGLQFAYRFGFDAARTPPLAERTLPGVEDSLRRVFYARFNYPASDELVWAVAGDAVREGFRLGRR